MQVILLENINALGKAGEIHKVSDGYARNFLFPRRLALEASESNLKLLAEGKKLHSRKSEKARKQAEGLAGKISGINCVLKRRVGDHDRLFGSVNAKDIAEAMAAMGFEINRRNIYLEEPLKSLGQHKVKIKLAVGVVAEIQVTVDAQE